MGLNPIEHHDFKAVPRTLIQERVADVREAIRYAKFDDIQLDEWVSAMGISAGNIESFIREIVGDESIHDVVQIFKGLVHMAQNQDEDIHTRVILNASDRELPPMLDAFIKDVLKRMRHE